MVDHPSPSEVAETFELTAADYFWPAIACKGLNVHHYMGGDERYVTEDTIRDHDSVAPLIDCYERRANIPDALGSELSEFGRLTSCIERDHYCCCECPSGGHRRLNRDFCYSSSPTITVLAARIRKAYRGPIAVMTHRMFGVDRT